MTEIRAAICELCLPDSSFEEDVRLASKAGYQGISIDERKLQDTKEGECLELFRASGLRATGCCAREWAILPVAMRPEPKDPGVRIDTICAGIRRLAVYHPETVLVATGGGGFTSEAEGRRVVVEGLRRICSVGDEYGVRISLEPMTGRARPKISLVESIADTLALIDEVGCEELGIVVDTWHMFDSPDFRRDLVANVDRVTAVQLADYRVPRTRRDRLMPGDGTCDVPGVMRDLREAGYQGWYDLEVFSEELWMSMSRSEFIESGLEAMRRCWVESTSVGDMLGTDGAG